MPPQERLFEKISAAAAIGHLAITTADGYPRSVPVNFVTVGTTVYFHGSPKGEKAEALRMDPDLNPPPDGRPLM